MRDGASFRKQLFPIVLTLSQLAFICTNKPFKCAHLGLIEIIPSNFMGILDDGPFHKSTPKIDV